MNSTATKPHKGGVLAGLGLCVGIELESVAFKGKLGHLLTLRHVDLEFASTVFLLIAFGSVVFLVIPRLHRYRPRLVALGVIMGLILSALFLDKAITEADRALRQDQQVLGWMALGIDVLFGVGFIGFLVYLASNPRAVWRATVNWFMSEDET